MNLATKIISGLIIAGGIGIISTPIIYQKQINKVISKQTQNLAKQDIIVKETNNKDSFFNIDRKYILTIKDITPIIKDIYPNMRSYQISRLKKNLDNTQFLVELNMLKYPISHKNAIKISLYKLNDAVTTNLDKDFTGKEILDFIKNKGLEVLIDTNSLDIAKATLKNIDLTLHKSQNSSNIINIKVLNSFMLFNNKISTNIGNISFDLKDNNSIMNASIKNIKYSLLKQNDFNYKTHININNISYFEKHKNYLNNKYKTNKLNVQNISSTTNVTTIVNNLNLSNGFEIEKLKFNNTKNSILVNNLKFNYKIEKIDFKSVKDIVDAIQNKNSNSNEIILKSANTIINKGFNLKINPISVNKIVLKSKYNNINIDKTNITFNAILHKNNFKIGLDKTKYLLQNIDANLNINTTKSNIDLISKLTPSANMILPMVSTSTKNGVKIDISYKNGELMSNGKRLF